MSGVVEETVSQGLVLSYRRKGYVRVPGLLSADEVQEFHDLVIENREAAMARQDDHKDENMLHRVVNAWRKDERFARITLHPKICAAAKELAGADLRLWHDQVMIKPSGGTPTYMHSGQPNWSHQPNKYSHAITAWIALVDVPLSAGCMGYIAGTHKNWDMPQHMGVEKSFFDYAPELIDEPVEFLPLKAGDVAFHHGYTAHCAAANASGKDRIAATVNYMDVDTRLKNITHAVTDELKYKDGDILNDESYFPLI